MRTVMIVDDEALVRVGLQSIIDWNAKGYQLLGAYKNGQEALEAIRIQAPDILLTDIRMPEMDGLELISEIRSSNIEMNILILSSYEEFEYLRKSIQLGVQDYIQKLRMDPDELLNILDNLPYTKQPRNSGFESEHLSEMNEKQELLASTRQISGIQVNKDLVYLGRYLLLSEKWKSSGDRLAWIVMMPVQRERPYLESELKALSVLITDIMGRLNGLQFIGIDGLELHGVFITEGQDMRDQQYRQLTSELKESVRHNLNIEIIIGGSQISLLTTSLSKLRKEAELMLLQGFYHGPGVYVEDKAYELRELTEEEWMLYRKAVQPFVINLDVEGLCQWMGKHLTSQIMQILPQDAIRLCRIFYYAIVEQLQFRYPEYYHKAEEQLSSFTVEMEVLDFRLSWQDVVAVTQKLMMACLSAIHKLQDRSPWVEETINYMNIHYGESLRLDDMAEKVHFSGSYFSQKFYQETGQHFSDYLAQIRIRKAIELYKQKDLGTEEIAAQVGYPNANYFTKVFKKVTGKTLSEYLERKR
ncbi:hypothetical protein A8709_32715 [Paenibacillus pectinilyticus]|uniref:DNA-binding response regulator n=1 Tax=Paenibacillus pectinilyticus TaxID=512399 RepID=A0A1C0ZWW1_9BACL|nr:response regulator [Paenibacillus pectinilyticus]OCT12580.1 hypothetical protein A8709_32715 [Paenibacillus pectinilyticus]